MTREELRELYKEHPIKVSYWATDNQFYFRGPFKTEEEAKEAHKLPIDPEKDIPFDYPF